MEHPCFLDGTSEWNAGYIDQWITLQTGHITIHSTSITGSQVMGTCNSTAILEEYFDRDMCIAVKVEQ